MLLFNRPIRVLLLQTGNEAINTNNDDEYCKTLKTRAQTPVTFWDTDPTNHHGISYDPYMPMYINHGTYMRQSDNDRHIDASINDKTHISMDPQQDSAGVNNFKMPRLVIIQGQKM